MSCECMWCGSVIEDDSKLIEYDHSPFHKSCIKEKYRKDNPSLSDEEYAEFDKKTDAVDKWELDGNLLIPVLYERNSGDLRENSAQGEEDV